MLEDAEHWYRKFMASPLEWSIECKGKCIGQARYAVGIFDSSHVGKGIGTEVTNAVIQYAFQTLDLHRVDLRVLDYNKRAIACYEKCGFIKEGVEREGALIEDRWQSDIMMSILEHEYIEQAGR